MITITRLSKENRTVKAVSKSNHAYRTKNLAPLHLQQHHQQLLQLLLLPHVSHLHLQALQALQEHPPPRHRQHHRHRQVDVRIANKESTEMQWLSALKNGIPIALNVLRVRRRLPTVSLSLVTTTTTRRLSAIIVMLIAAIVVSVYFVMNL
jgi:hypothetical protein